MQPSKIWAYGYFHTNEQLGAALGKCICKGAYQLPAPIRQTFFFPSSAMIVDWPAKCLIYNLLVTLFDKWQCPGLNEQRLVWVIDKKRLRGYDFIPEHDQETLNIFE